MKPNEEYVAWDPEKAYRQAGAGTFRLIAVILVILFFGGIWIMGALENQKKTGEVALNTSMAFEEADSLLLDSGYTPLGRIHRSGSSTIRSYDSRILFGCLPAYSTLDTAEGKAENWIRLSHIFEEGGTHSLADPGDICRFRRCNILKINDEELVVVSHMFGYQDLDDAKVCEQMVKDYHLQMLVLTCGTNGSHVFTADGEHSFQPTPKVTVADTVGAGDSFTGSFCAAILNGKPVAEAHRIAVEVSAYVCTQNGAMPKYPAELVAKVK